MNNIIVAGGAGFIGSNAKRLLVWEPTVSIEEGIKNAVKGHIENTKLIDKC
ncbi:MAG: hypothetical protein M0Q46_04225 [Endomicrobiales bacterium]|nr:hypothetical protein [Endomicrobiales bacterium]